MKAKVIFGAMALLTTFAACSNEELTTIANENNLNDKEIVGAKLVSQGMTVNLGGIDSRVNASGWEANDQLAMAWYNIGGNIFADQPETNWANADTDGKIYANHLFTKGGESNSFVTKSNIYEGAHFLYFPYEYMAKVDVKKVNVNADPQEAAYDVEVYNKALYVSAKDYIKAADLDVETGELTKEFVLAPAVNVLKVTASAEDVIAQNEFFGSLKIAEQRIYVNGDPIFNVEGEVAPKEIPAVVRYPEGVNKGKIDREKTLEALKNAKVIASEDETAKNGINTVVKYDMPLSNDANIIRAFTLPTELQAKSEATDAQFTYIVAKEDYVMGQFITNISQKENKEQIEKLLALVSEEGYKVGDKAYSLTELITANGNVTPVGLSMNLLKKAFTADYNIKDLAEWNYTVAMVDALNNLKEEGAKDIVPTFILDADITFNEGEIKTPAAGVNVLAAGKKLIVAKDATWPANLAAVFAKDGQGNDIPGEYLNVVVKKDATLTVESDATGKLIDMVPEAGATIDLTTDKSKIHLASKGNVEGARINIGVYGAKVELWNGQAEVQNATIAYALPADYQNYKINNLIAKQDQEQDAYALVNTLVIGEGVVFNMAEVQADITAGDPYTGESMKYSGVLNYEALQNVNIEMNNGTIKNVAVDANDKKATTGLSNVFALAGENTVSDVNVDNVTVKKGAKLTLTTDVADAKDKNGEDNFVHVEVEHITTEATSTITADNVVVEYGNWTNKGTSTVAGREGAGFAKK